MSSANLFSLVLFFGMLWLFTPALGSYLAKVFSRKKVVLSFIIEPCERLIYKICLINPEEEMHWKRYAQALLGFSGLSIVVVFLLQIFQSILPLNPQSLPDVPWALALNTSISFVTNTNWQAYSGESTLSYLVQTLGLTVQNFASAAVGLAVLLAFIRGLTRKNAETIGNFWSDIVRSSLYVFLPLSVILAIVLISQGVIQNFSGYIEAKTLEGIEQVLPMGPAASQIAIKQLGTNGGGFFAANSAHPFENPTPVSNFLEMLSMLLIPSALVYMFGVMTNQYRHALLIYLVMSGFLLSSLAISLWSEQLFNNASSLNQALVGKEMRFGIVDSITWSTITTAASNGSVNAMHDSLSPLAGGIALLQILLGEIIFGGVGSGLYGMLLFVLLTVFLSGLMVGRTPEYLGKKIEAFDMQMVVVAIVLPSAVVLIGTGLSCVLPVALKSLGNNGPHGFFEILYAWGSAANNNGSAFAGLNANTDFYNLGLSLAMLLGRFGVILPVLAIAGNLAAKKQISTSFVTLATDTPIFAILLVLVIIAIGALTFFPALALGPLVEHWLMLSGRTF